MSLIVKSIIGFSWAVADKLFNQFLYLKKPVMYLLNSTHSGQFFNDFGQEALNSCEVGYGSGDIRRFLEMVVSESAGIKEEHKKFILHNIEPYFLSSTPSELIIQDIKQGLVRRSK